jgi:hypothetical protein
MLRTLRPHLPAARLGALLFLALTALPARAIPPFARKYGTACQTCHTVFPRLNPFGEAFRRRGLRFPGVDSDAMKQEPIALGQPAYQQLFPNAVWPGLLPAAAPLGLSLEGNIVAHPDVRSGGGQADNGTAFSLRDLVAEAHLWAGGSVDEHIGFFGEITVSSEGHVSIDRAEVHFGELFGPPGAFNLLVGKASPNLTSFGPHSSYLADMLLPAAPVAALFGAQNEGFVLGDPYPGLELNGVIAEHVTYGVGLAAGAMIDVRPTENVWGHLGLMLGGGDDGFWSGTSLTLDVYAYRAGSRFTSAAGTAIQDVGLVLGGAARLQLGAVTLDTGFYGQSHDHVQADNPGVPDLSHAGALLLVHYDELSWVALPWLVPVLRVEYLSLAPQGAETAWDLRFIPGVALLVRQNIKVVISARFESAAGVLPAGWRQSGGFAAPTADHPTVAFENEAVLATLTTAF